MARNKKQTAKDIRQKKRKKSLMSWRRFCLMSLSCLVCLYHVLLRLVWFCLCQYLCLCLWLVLSSVTLSVSLSVCLSVCHSLSTCPSFLLSVILTWEKSLSGSEARKIGKVGGREAGQRTNKETKQKQDQDQQDQDQDKRPDTRTLKEFLVFTQVMYVPLCSWQPTKYIKTYLTSHSQHSEL